MVGHRSTLAAALLLTACATGGESTVAPGFPVTPPPSSLAAVPGQTLEYLQGWADNDSRQMVRHSAPRSPAREYARYWGDLLAAGRVDADAPDIAAAGDGVAVTYPDGSSHTFTSVLVDARGRVRSWVARPGGPLERRIVAGPVRRLNVGPVGVAVVRQYRNGSGDLRIILRLRNTSRIPTDVGVAGYTPPGGSVLPADVGSGGQTGVVQLQPGAGLSAVVSVMGARPGGELEVFGYGPGGAQPVSASVGLPAP